MYYFNNKGFISWSQLQQSIYWKKSSIWTRLPDNQARKRLLVPKLQFQWNEQFQSCRCQCQNTIKSFNLVLPTIGIQPTGRISSSYIIDLSWNFQLTWIRIEPQESSGNILFFAALSVGTILFFIGFVIFSFIFFIQILLQIQNQIFVLKPRGTKILKRYKSYIDSVK